MVETVETSGVAESEISSELVVVNNEKDQDISFTFLVQMLLFYSVNKK